METREILTRRLSEADKKFAEDSLRSIVTFGFNLPKNGSYFVDGAVSVVSGSYRIYYYLPGFAWSRKICVFFVKFKKPKRN